MYKREARRMITKEQFLENTSQEELFCLIDEFKQRYNEEHYPHLHITDKQASAIVEQMIQGIKGSAWL